MQKGVKRFDPSLDTGLTQQQIKEREEENLVNYDTSVPTKSIKRILYENFFTLFNFLNLGLALAVFLVGSYKNMLFLGIVFINTTISTWQEIHSKRVIDKLAILASSKVTTIRNSQKIEISINDIVLDDILEFNTGNQIPVDCILMEKELEVNESCITGEPNNILKKNGDLILSGSFITSGKARVKVEHIGEENYTAKISNGAKYIKKVNSEIMNSLNRIIKFLSLAIIPIGILFFANQYFYLENTIQITTIKTVAAIIGMIPEGLVLLTSTVLAVSVIRLAKSKVLVQELYCTEILARVDTLCLDKTGTLTEGIMQVKKIIPVSAVMEDRIETILANLGKFSTDINATIEGIRNENYSLKEEFSPNKIIPFSSQKKWSGIEFKKEGTYILGAPERVLKTIDSDILEQINQSIQDFRVLMLAHSPDSFQDKELPNNLKPIALILMVDKIRKNASQTLDYFKEQGVSIKIISGDNPITVSKIAKQVNLDNYNKYIDMTTIQTQEQLEESTKNYTIFGRVSPTQKKELVLAMQKQGKTVAMTGDGVNDVLALKTADCSIAMANGSTAAKNVSQLVLLDSDFSSMPKVVAEGRRTINNIQRSATLFLAKTIYSSVLALLFLFIGSTYPFEPIQLSLISVATIGIPSFVLALEPNKEKIKGDFLKNVIKNSLPTATTVVLNIFAITILHKLEWIGDQYYSSLCVISTGVCGLILLFKLAQTKKSEHRKLPISIFRFIIAILMSGIFLFGLLNFSWLFSLCSLTPILSLTLRIIVLSILNFTILNWIIKKLIKDN